MQRFVLSGHFLTLLGNLLQVEHVHIWDDGMPCDFNKGRSPKFHTKCIPLLIIFSVILPE